ncbi:MAG: aldo/keto reductase [Clostridia bacterium]|nr:aldo/keto reductase [Clostridia bacterium]
MRFPLIPGTQEIDTEAAQAIVDRAYAAGVNYFDSAFGYHDGKSEGFIGAALRKYPRESYRLVTKMPGWLLEKEGDPEAIFQKQLQRTGADYFDYYLLHAVSGDNYQQYRDSGAIAYCEKMLQEGKIRHFGFSFHGTPDALREIIADRKWDFAQIQLNYMDWEKQDAKTQYAILEQAGIPVVIMEPVRGGALADLSPEANALLKAARPEASIASWAIRFAASLPGVMTVLSGMTTMQQLEDNLKTVTEFEPYTDGEYALINKALEAFRSEVMIPCTGCRYCMDCPQGVEIPQMFTLYNALAVDKRVSSFKERMGKVEPEKRAHNCIGCGVCATHCPQRIDIPARMNDIAQLEIKHGI